MIEIEIRAAFEKRLAAMAPALPTALENQEFKPPAAKAPYQRASLLPARIDNPTLDEATQVHRGVFQVLLVYPPGEGAGPANARAKLVQAQFPAGLAMLQAGQVVRVRGTPWLAPAMDDPDAYKIPVSVAYTAIRQPAI